MAEMKKHIIELPENTHWIQWIMEGTKDHHPYMDYKQVEDLTPYTEPDLDAIKQEEYEKGYKTAKVQCNIQAEKDLREVGERHYQKGLNDAWEAARKICTNWVLSDSVLSEIFGMDKTIDDIMKENTASEVIAKIQAYEQEKEGFHVGDEFENGSGKRFVITKMNGNKIDRYIDEEGKTYCLYQEYRIMRKTGRHFPEIAAVLEKMQGE